MNKIYADLDKKKYTPHADFAKAYILRNPDANVMEFQLAQVKWVNVAPDPPEPKGKIIFAIVSRTVWEGLTEAQRDTFNLAFDPQPFDFERRVSLDGTQALFRARIKTQAQKDKLDNWVSQGFLVAWYPYNHLEFDGNGNPTDITIKEFLSGNADWESPEV